MPKRAKKLITLIPGADETGGLDGDEGKSPGAQSEYAFFLSSKPKEKLSWYREFVYISGGVEREGKRAISPEIVAEVVRCHGKLGIGDGFRYRVKNISEGLAIGTYSFISLLQEKHNRKFIRPRAFLSGNILFATRVLCS
ncbi:MAG: hypothetical protein GY950_14680 [bacterium]|nr:hypothetical protein [bacterium]